MPKKPLKESRADANAAPGGTASVDRALSLLSAFTKENPSPGLAELAAATGLYKSTILRLLSSLEHAKLIQKTPSGVYELGSEIGRLHAVFSMSNSLDKVVLPVLKQLVRETEESAAYHVIKGSGAERVRICLFRVDSPHPIRDHIRAGDVLPAQRGTGGRVLMAFTPDDENVPPADRLLLASIRERGYYAAVGDRLKDVAGISAPVFDAAGQIAAAVTLTMPSHRYREEYIESVLKAAATLTGSVDVP